MREKEKRILLEDERERGEKGERCEGREKESKIEYKQPEEENHQQGVPERHHNGSYNQVSSFFEEKKRKIQSPEWRRVSFDWLVGSQNISILDKKESGLSTHHHGNKRRSKQQGREESMETRNGNIDDSEKEWNELEVLENEEEGS